ncbi:MAG: hypothetical protein AB1894_13975 [Chloroflexota bacterium]
MNANEDLRQESLDPPNHIIEDLYLEINNIAQGVTMGIFVLVQGISISLVGSPVAWLVSTGLFLFFGSGFYVLNLQEITRKQQAGLIAAWPNFVAWQRRRGQELFCLSLAAFGGAGLVSWAPVATLPAALLCLGFAIWQLALTNDYRRLRFIRTGV